MSNHQTTTHAANDPRNGAENPSMAEAAREQAEHTAAQAREAADTARKQAGEIKQRAADQTTQFVRDNPALALAGAIGVGVVLGLMLRGRD